MTLTPRIEEVAAQLLGTCKSLCEVATDEEADSKEFCRELDYIIFRCEVCDWWDDADEQAYDKICKQCAEEGHQ